MANVGAGVFQGMPVSTSLSASSLNESAGARTPVASLVTGGLVIATLIVLAPLFSDLPKAVLAAIIIDAVVFGMIDVAEFRRLYRVTRFDFWIAVAAILGVLSAGVLAGVVIGIVLSLALARLRRDAAVDAAPRPRSRTRRCSATSTSTRTTRRIEGIAVLRLDGGLFFATAEALEERIRAILEDRGRAAGARARPRGRRTSSTPRARRSSPSSTSSSRRTASASGSPASKPQVLAVLGADGIVDRIGADHIHGNVHRAVEAEQAAPRASVREL